MKYLIIIFLFLINIFSCSRENKTNDDINNKIYKLQKKTNKTNKDSMLFYLGKTKNLFNQAKNLPDSLKARNEYLYGKYHYKSNNIDSSIFYYNKAINYSKDSIYNKKEVRYFLILTNLYLKKSDYSNSLITIEQFENLKFDENIYLNQLAYFNNYKRQIYSKLGNYKKALIFNKKNINYCIRSNDTLNLINGLINQANLNYYNLNDKKKAYTLLDSIIKFNSRHKTLLNSQIYQNKGVFKFYDGNYKASLKNYLIASSYLNRIILKEADFRELAINYSNISEVLIKLNKFDLAKKYIDSVNLYSKYIDNNLRKFSLQNELYLSFLTTKNFNLVSKRFDSLYNFINKTEESRINKKITALNEASKKEQNLLILNQNITLKNIRLEKNQILLFSILIFLILSSFIGILLYRQKKIKFTLDKTYNQLRLFRSQMNPHFNSNILYSIQNLIKKDTNLATVFLIKFSRLMRLNLENSLQNFVPLTNEIEILTKYLELKQLEFPNKFNFNIKLKKIEDESFINIPPMLIQPFVENAIEHGFKNINYLGQIDIVITLKEKFISCQIIDNGIGINNRKKNTINKSTSTELIKDIVFKLTNKKITLKNNSKKISESGITVNFNIPYKKI